jgi:hypothetical protein
MPEFRLTKNEEAELQSQFERWKHRLNWHIAPLIFGIGITGIVSPDYRKLIGYIGMAVLAAAFLAVKNYFPSVFQSLREKNRTYKEEIIYRGIASYYFSVKNMIKHFPVYFLAIFILVADIVDLPKIWNM